MTGHMMNQAQGRVLQNHQRQEMRLREPARLANVATLHPQYKARRKADGSNLVKHALGTLLVIGALMMMVNA